MIDWNKFDVRVRERLTDAHGFAKKSRQGEVQPAVLCLVMCQAERARCAAMLRRMGHDPQTFGRELADAVADVPRDGDGKRIPISKALEGILERASAGTREGCVGVEAVFAELVRAHVADRPAVPACVDTTDWKDELEKLVGQERVKREVQNLVDCVMFNQERVRNGLPAESLTQHLVFTGNPGTGKTTVARILAKIYRQLGVLKKGHLVEVDRSGLVAGFVGQSELKTDAVVDSALDGVLFIDEAYSLAHGGGSDYGAQVIDTLVKRMEDERARLVVIVAGYTDEMQRFIEMNPGLKSRFAKYIEFPDYTGEELTEIFIRMAKAKAYIVGDAAVAAVRKRLDAVAATGGRDSGNGRFVRTMFDQVVSRMAARVMSDGRATKRELQVIRAEDVGS